MSNLIERLNVALTGRYVVERQIGRGGMATVYLAQDQKHGRSVALKVLRPELGGVGYHPERFLREIRIVAGLTHPNILPLYDSGESDGLLYYVMPLVPGESLRRRLDQEKQFPIDEAVGIARSIAAALDYAHQRDVLHRDIKPANILFSAGQPVVTDFGVARAISACRDDESGLLTEGGIAVGTPTYMSPEQASGDQELDGRSDLYSLACVLYEMLAGQPPFAGANVQAIMAQHMTAPIPALGKMRANVPPPVEGAITRALAKAPEDRFADANEFAQALVAPATSAAYVVPVPEARRTIAVLPFVNSSPDPDNEYFSDGMTDELINALTKVEGLRVASRTSVFALKGTQLDIRSIGTRLSASAVLEGSVRKVGQKLRITAQLSDVTDGRLLWSERYDRELEDVFAIQDEIASTIVTTLQTGVLGGLGDLTPHRYTENVRAYNLYLRGRYHWNQRSQASIAEGVKYFEQAIAEDAAYALAYTGLADSHALQVDYRGAPVAQGMRRAKVEARRALELDDTLAEAHTSLAWVTFIYDWDWSAAERGFRRAIKLNPRYATARQWYAWLLMAMGRVEQALAEGRMALELDPASVSVRRSMGWLYHYARQHDKAAEHLRRATAMDPTASENHRVLGLILMQQGKHDEAEASLREAISASGDATYATAALAYLHALRGDRKNAQGLLDELHAHQNERYVSPVAFTIIHVGLGETDRALESLERAHEERRGWLAYLNVEPLLDPIRSEPRFAELLRRMKLA
ncbi:MAG: protein kinase [Gemmatimonadales bacterium]|nr:protein kinase [Gemmatimonadales bacterium]NIN11884.1 protein kinase [Gemmatimonadales bacterium]NIN50434.1 protein kinase [Gemmatimonadales bacterium]NIP07898.1 protein kinase [Gemmatimonadales bacterium]NIR01922.1 protein kinase [Gemmatimonadales bacterium]